MRVVIALRMLVLLGGVLLGAIPAAIPANAQTPLPDASPNGPHRTRLYLKDGSYQVVMRFTVVGNVVRFLSAERGGETEEIPLALVDLEATKRWEQQHSPSANAADGTAAQAPRIDPELAKEEADRAARTPEVAPNLNLPELENLLALDTWHGTPELVPLTQSDGELNRQTGHNILRGVVNPRASKHQILVLKGEKSPVQMHVEQPAFYLRVGDPAPADGSVMTVDTHGANIQTSKSDTPPSDSRYVVLRTDVRLDARVIASFDIASLAEGQRQEDVFATDTQLLPGGHWRKIVPREPLLIGEYILMEVLSDREVNLGVWDFGVHPRAPENRDVVVPQAKRPLTLEHRSRD